MSDAPQPLVLVCPGCHAPMTRDQVVEEQGETWPRMEVYVCGAGACRQGKLAVVYELSDANAPVDEGYVKREIARHGAFFPADYGAGRGRFG